MIPTYSKSNFHKHTFCVFTEVPLTPINSKPNYTSKSGSRYYFTSEGVYRISNHWGRAANCKWRLLPMNNSSKERTKAGFAYWKDFHPDNDIDKMYYIEMDFDTHSVTYQHCKSVAYDGKTLLRTAGETTKRIKEIRNLLSNESWIRYYDMENSAVLKQNIITRLIQTNSSLQQIKADFLNIEIL